MLGGRVPVSSRRCSALSGADSPCWSLVQSRAVQPCGLPVVPEGCPATWRPAAAQDSGERLPPDPLRGPAGASGAQGLSGALGPGERPPPSPREGAADRRRPPSARGLCAEKGLPSLWPGSHTNATSILPSVFALGCLSQSSKLSLQKHLCLTDGRKPLRPPRPPARPTARGWWSPCGRVHAAAPARVLAARAQEQEQGRSVHLR